MAEFSTGSANNLPAVSTSATPVDVVLPNPLRVAIYLVNSGANDVTLHFGEGTPVIGEGIVMKGGGGTFSQDALGVIRTGKIQAVSASASTINGVEMLTSG